MQFLPKSKIIDGIKITEFKNIQFKENEFDFKTKLVLPDEHRYIPNGKKVSKYNSA